MNDPWAKVVGYCRVKTNIYDSYFYEREDEDKFYDYINNSINYRDQYIVDNVPSDIISQLKLFAYDFSEDHTLTVRIDCDRELSMDDLDALEADTEFAMFIENTVMPEFIAWFNNKHSNITFPIDHDRENNWFSYIRFDGQDFYTILYRPDADDPKYRAFSAVAETFQLVHDYEFEVYS